MANIGAFIKAASVALSGVKRMVNNPNFVQDNNAFVRQEQGKAVSYRYGR